MSRITSTPCPFGYTFSRRGFSQAGMNKRSAQRHESSNPVRPIYTTSVEMPHEVEMQKEDEDEEDRRGR